MQARQLQRLDELFLDLSQNINAARPETLPDPPAQIERESEQYPADFRQSSAKYNPGPNMAPVIATPTSCLGSISAFCKMPVTFTERVPWNSNAVLLF